jgi:hypothetical protein
LNQFLLVCAYFLFVFFLALLINSSFEKDWEKSCPRVFTFDYVLAIVLIFVVNCSVPGFRWIRKWMPYGGGRILWQKSDCFRERVNDFLEFFLNFHSCVFCKTKFLDQLLESFHQLLDSTGNGHIDAWEKFLLFWKCLESISERMLWIWKMDEDLIWMFDLSNWKSILRMLMLNAWLEFLIIRVIEGLFSVGTSMTEIELPFHDWFLYCKI